MKLHEAIDAVLADRPAGMSARELADEIERRGLYIKGDGEPASPGQVNARVLVAEGAIAGTVSVSPGGVAVLQGAIVAQIQNEGIVAMDNALPEGDGAVANIGSGRSLTFDELPPELRRKLPTMTTETRQTP
jgi:hypothetical protein